MVYTQEEKKKMDNLLEVFAEYTAQHPDFDIAYSDKTGYVRLIIADCAEAIFFKLTDFDDLMDMFCMEIVSDEVDKQLARNPKLMNWNVNYNIVRCRLQNYIDQLDKSYQEQAETIANRYILKQANRLHLP